MILQVVRPPEGHPFATVSAAWHFLVRIASLFRDTTEPLLAYTAFPSSTMQKKEGDL